MRKKVIGWIEWVSLPDLPVKRIKAKADTGAKTSALHAENIRVHLRPNGRHEVTFTVFPSKKLKKRQVTITCPLRDSRLVKSSTGLATLRPVVATTLKIGHHEKRIELTLINRGPMEFRMLLGRSALKDYYVDPGHSYLLTKHKKRQP